MRACNGVRVAGYALAPCHVVINQAGLGNHHGLCRVHFSLCLVFVSPPAVGIRTVEVPRVAGRPGFAIGYKRAILDHLMPGLAEYKFLHAGDKLMVRLAGGHLNAG